MGKRVSAPPRFGVRIKCGEGSPENESWEPGSLSLLCRSPGHVLALPLFSYL